MKTGNDTKKPPAVSAKEGIGFSKKTRQQRERLSSRMIGVMAFEIVGLDEASSPNVVNLNESFEDGGNASIKRPRGRRISGSGKRATSSTRNKARMRSLQSNVLSGPVILKGYRMPDDKGFSVGEKFLGISIPSGFTASELEDLLAEVTETARQFVKGPEKKQVKKTYAVDQVKAKVGIKTGLAGPAQIKEMVIEAGGLLKSSEIAQLRGLRTSNPSSMMQKWKDSGRVIALPYDGYHLYPDYLFDEKEDYKPRPVIKKIRETLSEKMGPWQMAFWFICGNNFLGGKTPRDVIQKDASLVLKAAQNEILGSLHG